MPQFESGTLAIGLIFPYENPVSESRLQTWLETEEFELIEQEERQHVAISPEGVGMEGEEGIAKKDDLRVLYQESADISQYSNSSFITIKNVEEVSFDQTVDTAMSLQEWFDEEIGIEDDISTIEVTLQSLIRIQSNSSLSSFLSNDTFDILQEFGGHQGTGNRIEFIAEEPDDPNDWYIITLDKTVAGNPNLWGARFVLRYDNISDINGENVIESFDNFLEHTQVE